MAMSIHVPWILKSCRCFFRWKFSSLCERHGRHGEPVALERLGKTHLCDLGHSGMSQTTTKIRETSWFAYICINLKRQNIWGFWLSLVHDYGIFVELPIWNIVNMEFSLLTLPNPFGWGSFSQVAALGQNFQIVWISRRRPTLKDMKYVAGVIVPLKFRTCCACTCKDYVCKHSQPKWHCHFGSRAFVT